MQEWLPEWLPAAVGANSQEWQPASAAPPRWQPCGTAARSASMLGMSRMPRRLAPTRVLPLAPLPPRRVQRARCWRRRSFRTRSRWSRWRLGWSGCGGCTGWPDGRCARRLGGAAAVGALRCVWRRWKALERSGFHRPMWGAPWFKRRVERRMQGRAVAVEQPPAVLQDSQIMHASSSPHKDLYIDNRLLLQLSPLCTSALATTAQAAMQAALGKHISPISHANAIGRPARRSAVVPQRRLAVAAASQQQGPSSSRSERQLPQRRPAGPATLAQLAALWAAAALPAQASEALSGGPPASSYYVSLGLSS